MVTQYVFLKFLHIIIAIIALGTSAGLGIVLEFYGTIRYTGPLCCGPSTGFLLSW